MKHKITNISEPTNDLELQKVKDAKSFSRGIIGIVASTAVGFVGMATYSSILSSGDFSIVPVALGLVTQIVSHGIVTPKLINHLQELYNKKGNETEISDTLSGGKKRWKIIKTIF